MKLSNSKPLVILFSKMRGKKACLKCEQEIIVQGQRTCPTCGGEPAYFGPKMRIPAKGHRAGWRKLREYLNSGSEPIYPGPYGKRRAGRIIPRTRTLQY